MKNLVILALLAACLYLWHHPTVEMPASAAAIPDVPDPTPAPATPPRNPALAVSRSQTARARGIIVGRTANGVLVDCDARSPDYGFTTQGFARLGGATSSKANIASLAALAEKAGMEAEKRLFGPLEIAGDDGEFILAEFTPPQTLNGSVMIAGLRGSAGSGVHIVVAPAGNDSAGRATYTAAIEIAEAQAPTTPTPAQANAAIESKYGRYGEQTNARIEKAKARDAIRRENAEIETKYGGR